MVSFRSPFSCCLRLLLLLALYLVALLAPSTNAAGLTFPLAVPFGFSTRGLDFGQDGSTTRNLRSAQHIATLQLALSQVNAYLKSRVPGLSLSSSVYQGNQIMSGSAGQGHNAFFDGSFGAYTIGSDVIGVFSADEDLETVTSMTSVFGGWGVATLMSHQDTEFSHGSKYPLKARIVPSDNFQSVLLVSVLIEYGWSHVCVLYSSDQIGIDLHTNFVRTLGTTTIDGNQPTGIKVLYSSVLLVSASDYTPQLAAAKATEVTIFILLMGAKMQAAVLQQGYTLGLFNSATQTIGTGLSTDDVDNGGKYVHQYLQSTSVSAATVATVMQGHMVLTSEPRVIFLTPRGQAFLKAFKSITPTRNLNGGFAPTTNTWLQQQSTPQQNPSRATCPLNPSTDCPTWVGVVAQNTHWFLDQCRVFDETTKNYWADGMDGRNPSPDKTFTTPGVPGFLYAAINGGGIKEPFKIDESKGTANYNYYFWGQALHDPAVDESVIPLWGTCLGLSKEDLDAIPADGSSVIDWKTLYIYDAVWLVGQYMLKFLATSGLASFADNADFISKTRSLFANVIPANKQSGQQLSTPLPLQVTGNTSFNAGISGEDNFLLGDRVTGFPFSLRNFQVDAVTGAINYLPVGYYDPQSFIFRQCSTSSNTATVLSMSVPCSQPVYRTPGNVLPSDMQPTLQYVMPAAYKVAINFFGVLALVVTIFFTACLFYFWGSSQLRMKQQYVLLLILVASGLSAIKVLIGGSWTITDASCTADYWLAHLSFRLLVMSLVFKLWRVHKIFNAKGFKRVRITESQIVTRILAMTTATLITLILIAGLGGSRVMSQTATVRNQLIVTKFCGSPNNLPASVLVALLVIFQALGLLGALYYAWMTKSVPPLVNEAHLIIPALLGTTVTVVTAFFLLLAFDPSPVDYSLIVNLIYAFCGIFGNALYFLPTFHEIYASRLRMQQTKTGSEDAITNVKPAHRNSNWLVAQVAVDVQQQKQSDGQSIVNKDDVGVRRRSSIPAGSDIAELHNEVAAALLRQAHGGDNKSKICQEKVLYWQSIMFKLAENAEYSGSGSGGNTDRGMSTSVYAVEDFEEDGDDETNTNTNTNTATTAGP